MKNLILSNHRPPQYPLISPAPRLLVPFFYQTTSQYALPAVWCIAGFNSTNSASSSGDPSMGYVRPEGSPQVVIAQTLLVWQLITKTSRLSGTLRC